MRLHCGFWRIVVSRGLRVACSRCTRQNNDPILSRETETETETETEKDRDRDRDSVRERERETGGERAWACVHPLCACVCVCTWDTRSSFVYMYLSMYIPGRTWTQGPRSLSSARGSYHMRRFLSLARRRGALVPLPGFSVAWV